MKNNTVFKTSKFYESFYWAIARDHFNGGEERESREAVLEKICRRLARDGEQPGPQEAFAAYEEWLMEKAATWNKFFQYAPAEVAYVLNRCIDGLEWDDQAGEMPEVPDMTDLERTAWSHSTAILYTANIHRNALYMRCAAEALRDYYANVLHKDAPGWVQDVRA